MKIYDINYFLSKKYCLLIREQDKKWEKKLYTRHVIGEKLYNTLLIWMYSFSPALPNSVNNDFNLLTFKTVKDFSKA